ncbi:MAG: hypothetical protein JWO67_2403 [Streptosporangiaceae bacterium]|nr:hypothetical protein [Streptosporangiaceae bacterium]
MGVRGWQPGDGVGFSAGIALDVDRHAMEDRDKAQRQCDAFATEVEQLKELSTAAWSVVEAVRLALADESGTVPVDVVSGVERLAKAGRERAARLAEVEAERDAMARDLIVLAHRRNDLRRMLAASPDQAYRNCLALSDRNEELRQDLNDLEKRHAELQKDVGLS